LINPDDHQPTTDGGLPDHLILVPIGDIDLDPIRIVENLVDVRG